MPTDSELRQLRQRAILALLAHRPVTSQGQLVEELGKQGIAATQSSVSRDLRDLGVGRVGGRYVSRPIEESEPGVAEIAQFLRRLKRAGPYLTVLNTTIGTAPSVGLAVDTAGWPEVVGSIAGDDTVFIATASERDQERLLRRLATFLPES